MRSDTTLTLRLSPWLVTWHWLIGQTVAEGLKEQTGGHFDVQTAVTFENVRAQTIVFFSQSVFNMLENALMYNKDAIKTLNVVKQCFNTLSTWLSFLHLNLCIFYEAVKAVMGCHNLILPIRPTFYDTVELVPSDVKEKHQMKTGHRL